MTGERRGPVNRSENGDRQEWVVNCHRATGGSWPIPLKNSLESERLVAML